MTLDHRQLDETEVALNKTRLVFTASNWNQVRLSPLDCQTDWDSTQRLLFHRSAATTLTIPPVLMALVESNWITSSSATLT